MRCARYEDGCIPVVSICGVGGMGGCIPTVSVRGVGGMKVVVSLSDQHVVWEV
jgi:hypothetical protein